MKKLISSKKGYKTIITVVALLMIIFMLLIFAALFNMDKKSSEQFTTSEFQSLDAEYLLKTFLQTPTETRPTDLNFDTGETVDYMDLLSRSCNSIQSEEHQQFEENAEKFFEQRYPDGWKMIIISHTPNDDAVITQGEIKSIIIGSSTRDIAGFLSDNEAFKSELVKTCSDQICKELALFRLNIRQSGMATQIIPCEEESNVIKIILLLDLDKEPEFDYYATTSYSP